jgi:hypothetical protein
MMWLMEVGMDGDRSREAFDQFLKYLGDKGLMAAATVATRRAAVSKILGILDDQEGSDVTTIDVDDLVARFSRLHGKNYTPDSLQTYKSRLKSALADFESYLNNPLAFRPTTQTRAAKSNSKATQKSGSDKDDQRSNDADRAAAHNKPAAASIPTSNIIPIPIRADLVVYIQGLPFDLTESEARKISGVVNAMAVSSL